MAKPKAENDPNAETIKDINLGVEKLEKKSEAQASPLVEIEITGHSARRLAELLAHPPKDPRRKKLIQDAVKKFPEPGRPTEIDIDL